MSPINTLYIIRYWSITRALDYLNNRTQARCRRNFLAINVGFVGGFPSPKIAFFVSIGFFCNHHLFRVMLYIIAVWVLSAGKNMHLHFDLI